MLISRSCAIIPCEPCQDLTVAALSRSYDVPQGCFEGVNCLCNAWVVIIRIRCAALYIKMPLKSGFFDNIKGVL